MTKPQLLVVFILSCMVAAAIAKPDLYVSGKVSADAAKQYSDANKLSTRYLAYHDLPAWLTKVHGKKSLDYGSGLGYSALYLLDQGFEVIGADINQSMLDTAQFPKHRLLVTKDDDLPFAAESFDLVFSSLVLFELDSIPSITEYLRHAKRVLKDDGYFIAVTASIHMYDPKFQSSLRNSDFPENYNAKSGDMVKSTLNEINLTFADYYWTEEDYRSAFHDSGLEICAIHYPLGKSNEPYAWQDELQRSPIITILAAKRCH